MARELHWAAVAMSLLVNPCCIMVLIRVCVERERCGAMTGDSIQRGGLDGGEGRCVAVFRT